jgi:cellulose synthase/poly-beta-1,6-N-acetylglucosamine synthase-like glycosyltransferase
LKPKHVLLLDAGTKPQKGSINKLYALMESQDDIGGACGDLGVELQMEKDGSWILNYA